MRCIEDPISAQKYFAAVKFHNESSPQLREAQSIMDRRIYDLQFTELHLTICNTPIHDLEMNYIKYNSEYCNPSVFTEAEAQCKEDFKCLTIFTGSDLRCNDCS